MDVIILFAEKGKNNLVVWNFFIIAHFLLLIIILALEKDFFSPSAILCEAYILSTICALYMKEVWNFTIHAKTVWIILLGNIWFVAIGFITRIMSKEKGRIFNSVQEANDIYYSSGSLLFLNYLCILILVIYAYFFFQMFSGFNFASFSRMMTYYRLNGDEIEGIPTIVGQSVKIVRAAAYICLFVFLNNFVVKKRKDVSLLVPIICFAPITLLSGGRFDLVIFVVFGMTSWILIKYCYYGKKAINIRSISKIAFLILVVLFVFSNTRGLVGRTDKTDFISYICSYLGGSLQCFDVYLLRNGETVQSSYWGQELLAGMYKLLSQFHMIEEMERSKDLGTFITANSVVVGNVYTAYRKMIHDFGLGGGYSSFRDCIVF